MLLLVFVILLLCGILYLLPAIIAFRRKHPNRFLISALNVMTGLTVLGWFFTLRAALSSFAPAVSPATVFMGAPEDFSSSTAPSQPHPLILATATSSTVPPTHQTNRSNSMGFFESIRTCFGKYFTFTGRASRSEYWYFSLFYGVIFAIAFGVAGQPGSIAFLPFFFPALAVSVRRLHDTNRSGWFILLSVVPLIGQILILIWYCTRGTSGENRFGADPLAAPESLLAKPVPGPAASVGDKAGQLAKIKDLLDSGAINQEEFDRMKKEVLAG